MAKSSPKLPRVFNKRVGPLTKVDKAFIDQFVADQPHEVTPEQVRLLAKLMRREPKTIRQCIEHAREDFTRHAQRYVEIHREAIETALASGDAKSLEVAVRGSQWAMENISAEGVRIIDTVNNEPNRVKVFVGVKLGGLRDPAAATNAEPSE